jgi:hypothetical protein
MHCLAFTFFAVISWIVALRAVFWVRIFVILEFRVQSWYPRFVGSSLPLLVSNLPHICGSATSPEIHVVVGMQTLVQASHRVEYPSNSVLVYSQNARVTNTLHLNQARTIWRARAVPSSSSSPMVLDAKRVGERFGGVVRSCATSDFVLCRSPGARVLFIRIGRMK